MPLFYWMDTPTRVSDLIRLHKHTIIGDKVTNARQIAEILIVESIVTRGIQKLESKISNLPFYEIFKFQQSVAPGDENLVM